MGMDIRHGFRDGALVWIPCFFEYGVEKMVYEHI